MLIRIINRSKSLTDPQVLKSIRATNRHETFELLDDACRRRHAKAIPRIAPQDDNKAELGCARRRGDATLARGEARAKFINTEQEIVPRARSSSVLA